MGYRIDYGPPIVRRKGGGRVLRLQLMTAAFLLLFVLLVKHQWPEGSGKLRQYLMPGIDAQELCFAEFVEEIQGGEPVGQALTSFCRSILDNARAD